jgi:DNA-binding transcriptional ArsR family regulator
MESVFEIIAGPNRGATLSLLGSSQQSVGEIERQLRMPQPTGSRHLRGLREAGFVESTVDAQRRLYRRNPEPLQEGMPGWLHSVGSGPLTWIHSNAISTEGINQHPRKGRLRRRR